MPFSLPPNLLRYFDSRIWLSDSGIRKAMQQGLLSGIEESDIQPMTVDLNSSEDVLIYGKVWCQAQTKSLCFGKFDPFFEARSTLRKHGLRVSCPSPYSTSRDFMLINPSMQKFQIPEGGRLAQTYIGGLRSSCASDFSHGVVLRKDEEIRRILKEGYLEIKGLEGQPIIEDGFIKLKPSGLCSISTNPTEVINIFQKRDSVFFKKQTFSPENGSIHIAPYMPANITYRGRLKLSPNVGIQAFYQDEDKTLQLNGVIDPGYHGEIAAQPFVTEETRIDLQHPSLLLRIIFFKDPVQTPYGPERNSTYQGMLWSPSSPDKVEANSG